MLGKVPSIKEFPKDDRDWRIDWLGAVERTLSEALIEVFLSPVRSGIRWPKEQKHFDTDTARVRIGVGQLPFLAIGSIWRNGTKQQHSSGYPQSMQDICIGSDTVRLVSAGTRLESGRWLIPPFDHRLPRETWSSQCLAIENKGDPFGLLLPVAEAIRFYYALSTDLAHIIFSGALRLYLDSVIDSSMSGMLRDRDRMVLKLRKWVADDDGWIIGRVLGDPFAFSGMKRVYDSLIRTTANANRAFPECGMPFEGTTRWKFRGIPLKGSERAPNRWLVFEIKQCGADFPYQELEVIRDNDSRKGDPKRDIPEEEKRPAWAGPQRTPEPSQESELRSGEQTDASLQRVQLQSANERFDALLGRSVIKSLKDQCRYKSASFRENVGVDAFGTADTSAGQHEVGRAAIEWTREEEFARRKGLPASFEAMLGVMEALNTVPGVSATVRPNAPDIAFLPPSKPSRHKQWSYLDFKSKRWREVLVIDIVNGDRYASLVEFEARRTEQFVAGLLVPRLTQPISNSALSSIFRQLVSVRGVWANLPAQAWVQLVRLKHTRPSPSEFATAIVKASFGA